MADVMIIGGGLSGLVAAHALENSGLDVTLIEVKRRLGGSLGSVQVGEAILDTGAFALADTLDAQWLEALDLNTALFPVHEGAVAFKAGTGALIAALDKKISATRLMRMAVSSIGELENGRFSICMENGLIFDAKQLIIALPARYAQRLFYGYISPITEILLDYHYDTIHHVSLVCKTDELPTLINPPDMAFVYIQQTEHESRVPHGYSLVQIGLRIAPERLQSQEETIHFLRQEFGLPEPLAAHVGYWAEADPISLYDDGHVARTEQIRAKLPKGIHLIGSDFLTQPHSIKGVTRLDERIEQGRTTAKRALESFASGG